MILRAHLKDDDISDERRYSEKARSPTVKTRKIYILLTRFPDKGSKAIETMTGCRYPHASIGLEEDMNTFYSFVTKGFIVEKITRYVRPDRPPYPCQLYELSVPEKVYDRIKETLAYFVEFKGLMHYTKFGLILSLLHIPYKRNRFGFFCTQFVAEILQQCGAARLCKKSTRYFSDDLKRLPGMKLHYQGNLQSMLEHFGLRTSLA